MTGSVEIFRADQLRPNPWLPQRRQFPIHWLLDQPAWKSLRAMPLVIYAVQITLASLQSARSVLVVRPGFSLCQITGSASAASPADGLGSAQVILYDSARRKAFSRVPIILGNMAGSGGNGGSPFMLRTPYPWTGGDKAPIQMRIQNRAAAQNTVSLVLTGREPQ